MQPIEFDQHGVIRFRRNRIVNDMLSFATVKSRTCKNPAPGWETPYAAFDLNTIVSLVHQGVYTVEELDQFYQLIGYSVSGYGDLSFTSKRSVREADDIADRLSKRKKTR